MTRSWSHKTGKRNSRRGFTLVEVLCASAIAATCLVMLAQGFGSAMLARTAHDVGLSAIHYQGDHVLLFQSGRLYSDDYPAVGSVITREATDVPIGNGFTANVSDRLTGIDGGVMIESTLTYELPSVGTITERLSGYRFRVSQP